MKDYIEQAHVTASPSFYADAIPTLVVRQIIGECLASLDRLDKVKKAIFYGKAPAGMDVADLREQFGRDRLSVADVHEDEAKAIAIVHGIIGKATEAGELLEALYASLFQGEPMDAVNVLEEVGDGFWYDALLARACGFTFEEAQSVNIAKLRKRYGEKFSEYDAQNRNLSVERAVLEGKHKSGGLVPSPCQGHDAASSDEI